MDIFQKIEDQENVVTTLLNLGQIHEDMDELSDAEDNYNLALKIAEQWDILPKRARSLLRLGSLKGKKGQYSEAHNFLVESLDIYQKIGNKKGIADAFDELGIFYWRTDLLEKYIETINQAMAIHDELNQPHMLCTSVGNLAIVYIKKQEYEKANELLSRRLSIAEQIHSKDQIANTYLNIATLQYYTDQRELSVNSFYIAQKILQEMGLISKAVDALTKMGAICCREGFSSGLEWFDEALKIAKTSDHISKVLKELGDSINFLLHNGKFELALKYQQHLKVSGFQIDIRL